MDFIKINRTINDIENSLSDYSKYPIIIPGLIKTSLGIAQIISGLAVAVFGLVQKDTSIVQFGLTHIVHGLSNSIAGLFEAIPGLGTILYIVRSLNKNMTSEVQKIEIDNGHRDKFLPYGNLVDEDLTIVTNYNEPHALSNAIYRKKLKNQANLEKTRVTLAQESINEAKTFNPTWPKTPHNIFVDKTFKIDHGTWYTYEGILYFAPGMKSNEIKEIQEGKYAFVSEQKDENIQIDLGAGVWFMDIDNPSSLAFIPKSKSDKPESQLSLNGNKYQKLYGLSESKFGTDMTIVISHDGPIRKQDLLIF